MRRQEGRSVARRNAECSPRLSGLRSLSIVRSQDWRGRPLGRRQSTGRRSVDARSAREWSSEAAARAICPNSLRRRCCISEEAAGWNNDNNNNNYYYYYYYCNVSNDKMLSIHVSRICFVSFSHTTRTWNPCRSHDSNTALCPSPSKMPKVLRILKIYHPPRIHYFISGSKFTFSTNLFHHSLLAPITGLPSPTILDRTYSAQRFSFFSYPRRARSALGVDTVLTLDVCLYVCMYVC